MALAESGYETVSPPGTDSRHPAELQGSDVVALPVHAAPANAPTYQLVQLNTPLATVRCGITMTSADIAGPAPSIAKAKPPRTNFFISSSPRLRVKPNMDLASMLLQIGNSESY